MSYKFQGATNICEFPIKRENLDSKLIKLLSEKEGKPITVQYIPAKTFYVAKKDEKPNLRLIPIDIAKIDMSFKQIEEANSKFLEEQQEKEEEMAYQMPAITPADISLFYGGLIGIGVIGFGLLRTILRK